MLQRYERQTFMKDRIDLGTAIQTKGRKSRKMGVKGISISFNKSRFQIFAMQYDLFLNKNKERFSVNVKRVVMWIKIAWSSREMHE